MGRRITLKDLEEEGDWTVDAVSIVDNPAVGMARFFATKKKERGMSITGAMASKGMTVKKAAEESGVDSKHLSAYKSGSRTMGRKAATKLSPVLGELPDTLMLGNRNAVLKRARDAGDRPGVLNATKSFVEIADELGVPDDVLDELVDAACKFAASNSYAGAANGWGMDEDYDPYGYEAEGRNRDGTRKANK